MGGQVVGDGEWRKLRFPTSENATPWDSIHVASNSKGEVFASEPEHDALYRIDLDLKAHPLMDGLKSVRQLAVAPDGNIVIVARQFEGGNYIIRVTTDGHRVLKMGDSATGVAINRQGMAIVSSECELLRISEKGELEAILQEASVENSVDPFSGGGRRVVPAMKRLDTKAKWFNELVKPSKLCWSPDQTTLYVTSDLPEVAVFKLCPDGFLSADQGFGLIDSIPGDQIEIDGLCVDTNGWLYVATSLGIQVLDQAGRVNFIIPTPKPPHDVCFGGKDLSDLFIACGDTIYKRPTKAHGYISGQMAPITPPKPKL